MFYILGGRDQIPNQMKKLLFAAVFMAVCSMSAWSQDIIIKRTGDDIKARVTEVGQSEIKYRKFDNQEGPVYSIPVSEVVAIRYENGTNDVFTQHAPYYLGQAGYGRGAGNEVPDVMPGMKYKDYKKFYKASDYEPQPGDKYSPALGGVLSWIIPGLGQMVNGEVGRGFKYFGSTIACSVVMGAGFGMGYAGMPVAGSIVAAAGAVALLAVDIAAIVDGVNVAKIKNMYSRDINGMAAVKVDLSPYFATLASGPACQPVAGAALRISF